MLKIRNVFKKKRRDNGIQFGFSQFSIVDFGSPNTYVLSEAPFSNYALLIPDQAMKMPTPDKVNNGMVSFISKEKWYKRFGCFFGYHKWRTYMIEFDRGGFDIHHYRCRKCLGTKTVKKSSK